MAKGEVGNKHSYPLATLSAIISRYFASHFVEIIKLLAVNIQYSVLCCKNNKIIGAVYKTCIIFAAYIFEKALWHLEKKLAGERHLAS